MMKHISTAAIAVAVLAAGCSAGPAKPAAQSAQNTNASVRHVTATTVKRINLPGKGGHGDVVVADPGANAVYVAQSPDNNVVVIDTSTNAIKAVVPNIQSVNGIAYGDQYVFAAEATSGVVAVISKATWQVVATVPSGGKTPDAVYYDSSDGSVFVANDGSNNMESFSATAPFAVLGSVNLQPSPAKTGPDLGTYVASADRIYQADDNNVLVIDPKTRQIEKVFTLQLSNGGAAKDMFYDQAHQLLWVATTNPEIVAINPDNGNIIYRAKTKSGIDQISGDTDQGLLFLGEKTGVMGVVDLKTHQNAANISTEPDFHTLGYLPGTSLVYAYLNGSNVVAVDKINVA